ncbi:thioredoxin family protein [Desulfobacula sp.]|uniref:thioredoxin family protein n=1 Tax=Desulfobacula sp. TaxID=2593537 RepID=UPI00262B979B|nr:thioredoxin family protein [Desulfobacula sp.]
MKKENVLVIAVICIVVGGVWAYNNMKSTDLKAFDTATPGNASGQIQRATTIDWQAYDQGMGLAEKQDKPIFLYFHADWCTYCRKLKQTTFLDTAVLNYLKDNFISIMVDSDKNKELSTQWRVKGLPTLWFLRSDASKISSIPGYVNETQLLQVLKYIHTKNYDKMTLNEFVKTL